MTPRIVFLRFSFTSPCLISIEFRWENCSTAGAPLPFFSGLPWLAFALVGWTLFPFWLNMVSIRLIIVILLRDASCTKCTIKTLSNWPPTLCFLGHMLTSIWVKTITRAPSHELYTITPANTVTWANRTQSCQMTLAFMLIRSNGAPLLVVGRFGRESCVLWGGFKYQTVAGELDKDEDEHEDEKYENDGEWYDDDDICFSSSCNIMMALHKSHLCLPLKRNRENINQSADFAIGCNYQTAKLMIGFLIMAERLPGKFIDWPDYNISCWHSLRCGCHCIIIIFQGLCLSMNCLVVFVDVVFVVVSLIVDLIVVVVIVSL